MKVRLIPVKAYDVTAPDGTSLGRFTVAERWRGMEALRGSDGAELVVMPESTGLSAAFGEICAGLGVGEGIEATVVMVAPSLAVKLHGEPTATSPAPAAPGAA